MSYRMNLMGFRRSKMRALLKSRDVDAVARLHAKIDSKAAYWKDSDRTACKAIVTRAINEGTPFSDLDAETYQHTAAASLLAHDQGDLLPTSCDCHRDSVEELRKRGRKYLRPEVRSLILGLMEGVTIFGQRFADVYSPYYATFALPKLHGFHEGLQELQDSLPAPDPLDNDALLFQEFLKDLTNSLGQIKDAELDCWLETG